MRWSGYGIAATLWRRWYVIVVGIVLSLFAMAQVSAAPIVYWTKLEVVILPPSSWGDGNALQSGYDALLFYTGVVQRVVAGSAPQNDLASADATLYGAGITEGSQVSLVNTGGQWATSITRPVIAIEVVHTDRQAVITDATQLADKVATVAHDLQAAAGTDPKMMMQVSRSPDQIDAVPIGGSRNRARFGILALGAGLTLCTALFLDARAARRRRARQAAPVLEMVGAGDES